MIGMDTVPTRLSSLIIWVPPLFILLSPSTHPFLLTPLGRSIWSNVVVTNLLGSAR
jgi:hypothetical protein